jgi:ribosomal protein S18 acetylase RimI-like enzyme
MLPENLKIIKAGIEHVTPLATLSIATFRDTFGPHNKKEDMDKYIAEELNAAKLAGEIMHSENIFFLAWHNDRLAGYAKLSNNNIPMELTNNNPIEMERIYVLQEYQDKKIGASLMKHCIEHAQGKQHDILWLGVWEHNYKAVEFYKQWGFEIFGSHLFILGNDHQTDVLMKKYL